MKYSLSEVLEKARELAPTCSSWAELGRKVNAELGLGVTPGAWRGIKKHNHEEVQEIIDQMNRPVIEGVRPQDSLPPFQSVYGKLVDQFNRKAELEARKISQRITMPNEPTGIAFVSDIHFGASGVNYERVFTEAKLIAETPGMYVVLVGDLVDNFILSKMLNLRMTISTTIPEEWVLCEAYIELLGDKLLGVVGGNHDFWSSKAAGVDILQSLLAKITEDVLYDPDELYVNFEMGGRVWPTLLRHKWRYSSILNPTHGVERAFERDQSKPFILGVGAHTHVSGLVREFNAGGETGLILQCGSYKEYDTYAKQMGFPKPNKSAATVAIFHPEYGLSGYSSLYLAVEILKGMRN